VTGPQKKRAHVRSHLSFFNLYPTYHPTSGVQVLQKAWGFLSSGVKAISRTAESNLDALSIVYLGPKRPFSVGECALWARLTGPQFSAQVEAVVSLVEAPANHCKAILIKHFLSRPSPANTPSHFKGHQGGSGRGGSDSRRSHSRGRLRGGEGSGCSVQGLGRRRPHHGALTMAPLGPFVCRA
jgi:hypothetical protein